MKSIPDLISVKRRCRVGGNFLYDFKCFTCPLTWRTYVTHSSLNRVSIFSETGPGFVTQALNPKFCQKKRQTLTIILTHRKIIQQSDLLRQDDCPYDSCVTPKQKPRDKSQISHAISQDSVLREQCKLMQTHSQ